MTQTFKSFEELNRSLAASATTPAASHEPVSGVGPLAPKPPAAQPAHPEGIIERAKGDLASTLAEAERVRKEADDYALNCKSEADRDASRVRVQADVLLSNAELRIKQAEEREREVEERERDAEGRCKGAIAKATARVRALRSQIKDARATLRDVQNRVGWLRDDLRQATNDLDAAKKEAQRQEAATIEAVDRHNKAQAEFQALLEQAEEQRRTLPKDRLDRLDQDEADVRRDKATLAKRQEALRERESRLDQNERAVGERERRCAEIGRRESALSAGEAALKRAKTALQKERDKLEEDERKLNDRIKQLQAGRRELNQRQEELDEATRKSRPLKDRQTIDDLTLKVRQHKEGIRRIERSLRAKSDELKHVRQRMVALGRKSGRDDSAIDLWLNGIDRGDWALPDGVVVVGSGPYPRDAFAAFLEQLGVSILDTGSPDAEFMVVGRDDWSEEELEEQIASREGQTLKVFSQEMFLAALVAAQDPFETEDRETLEGFAAGHPALEYLMGTALAWPSIECDHLPKEPVWGGQHVEETPLHSDGYSAGQDAKKAGITDGKRQRILTRFFTEADVLALDGYSEEYKAEWGRPGTRRRLWRMAHHLAWLVRTRSGRQNQEFAVEDWTNDLAWLKEKLYRPWMRFKWPGPKVR